MKTIKYSSQNIDLNDIKSVSKTLKKEFITQGPTVKEFEKKLKKKFGAKYCIVTSNGSSALKLSVKSLNLKKNDYVIVPSNTFIATANAVTLNNLKLIIAAINPNHGGLDLNCLKKTILHAQKTNKKIKAIINVFYAGQIWDNNEIYKFCKKRNIKIIDDACHAIGTSYKNNKKIYNIGSCKHSDITTFSFHSIKNITTAEGGCILTNNRTLYNSIKNLRSHGINREITKTKTNKINFKNEPWFYEAVEISENYRLSDLQCSLGISQLQKIEKFKKQKDILYKYYKDKIRILKRFLIPISHNHLSNTHWHLYPVLINENYIKFKKKLYLHLKKKKILTQVHYVPIYKHPIYKNLYKQKLHHVSDKFYKQILSLPFHSKLKIKEIDLVVSEISKFFDNILNER
jgi:dTDP-4-amino-4,6-dideoxygalactose transaminase